MPRGARMVIPGDSARRSAGPSTINFEDGLAMTLPKDLLEPITRAAALVLRADRLGSVHVPFKSKSSAASYRLDFYKMMKLVKERRSPLPTSVQERVNDVLGNVQVLLREDGLEFRRRTSEIQVTIDALVGDEIAEIQAAQNAEAAELQRMSGRLLGELDAPRPGNVVELPERPTGFKDSGFKYPLRGDEE